MGEFGFASTPAPFTPTAAKRTPVPPVPNVDAAATTAKQPLDDEEQR